MSANIEVKLRAILKEQVEIEADMEEIGLEDDLANWGLDSSGVLKLIVGIEEEFGFQFDDDDFDSKNFQSLNSLVTYVNEKL